MRGVALVVGWLLVLTMLAACTADDPGPSEDSGEPLNLSRAGQAGIATDAGAPAPAPEVEGATRGGTLTVVTSAVPATFDPARAAYTDTRSILSGLVTRSLTQLRYDRDTGQMVLVPDLATDLGRANEDRTRWSFTLREGVRYETGAPVTAGDVAYAVKRSFASDLLPGGLPYLRSSLVDGDRYFGPYATTSQVRSRPGAPPDAYAGDDFAGVSVEGDTITFHLRRPFGEMSYLASYPQLSPVPPAADTEPGRYGEHPVATGPYEVASSTPGSSLHLVRNAEWDPATDPGRHQYADGYRFAFDMEPAEVNGLLLDDAGEGRSALTYDSVEAETFRALRRGEADRLAVGTTPCTYLWYLDNRRITDLRVRQALGWAYPYREAWRASGEVLGVTRIAGTTLLPPGTAGRVAFDPLGNGGSRTDPTRARALLEQAGQTGFVVRWHYASDQPQKVAVKDAVVEALRAAGFDPQPIATTAAQLRTVQRDPEGPQNVVESGWCSDWPTGSSWFPAQWSADLVDDPAMPNPSMFADAGVQRRIDQITGTMTDGEADRAWGELDEQLLRDHYPAIVLGHGGVALAHGSQVGGMAVDETVGMPTFADLYVDQGR